ncbi:MAG: NAD-dependent malic enzyme, partial [Acidimicrobiia bacterium]|nr:NAD-dependent malic enzyme [Acidimicrobiia bacterium]
IYTPGVARVCIAISEDQSLADQYTWRKRTVAVVSNGSRVLGLGNIGPAAALPVMEGKALFYPVLVGLNAVPIMLDTQDPDEIIETVIRIAPGFGAIHLEDIASPDVYRIESELDQRLPIPVMHDDQHGTATVVLGAVLGAARKLDRPLEDLVFGQVGLGAAGSAIAALASRFNFSRIEAYDPGEQAVAHLTDRVEPDRRFAVQAGTSDADFEKVIAESDILVMATGRPGLIIPEQVRPGSVVFALSNPEPEISIVDAEAGGAVIAADGAIVNNVLAYPGLFLGAIDAGVSSITPEMRRAAAEALAELAPEDGLLPDPLDKRVHAAVAAAVQEAGASA